MRPGARRGNVWSFRSRCPATLLSTTHSREGRTSVNLHERHRAQRRYRGSSDVTHAPGFPVLNCRPDHAPVNDLNAVFPQGRFELRAAHDFKVALSPGRAVGFTIVRNGP